MANRYWVGGSGNWNDTSHWSATSGGSGGASVPNSNDSVIFNSNSATSDISVYWNGSVSVGSFTSVSFPYVIDAQHVSGSSYYIEITSSGNIRLHNVKSTSTYKLSVSGSPFETTQSNLYQTGVTSGISIGSKISLRTSFTGVNVRNQQGKFSSNGNTMALSGYLGSSSNNGLTLDITGSVISAESLSIANQNTVVNATGSTLTLNSTSSNTVHQSQKFNVVIVNSNTFSINGALSARKLVVQNGSAVRSSSSGSKAYLYMTENSSIMPLSLSSVKDITVYRTGTYYTSSSATDSGNNSGWTWSDAPTTSSLVDNFSSSSIDSTKWSATNSNVVQGSGWVGVSSVSTTLSGSLISDKQYLAESSSIKFKQSVSSGGRILAYLSSAQGQYGVSAQRNIPDIYADITNSTVNLIVRANTNYTSASFSNNKLFYKIREQAGTIYLDGSDNGIVYTNIDSIVASDYGLDTMQLTGMPMFSFTSTGAGYARVGEMNTNLEPTAEFTASPLSGENPLQVQFTDQSNFSPTSWNWTFGDGATSTTQNPQHTYSTTGTYTVSLQASNTEDSDTETKTGYITTYNQVDSGITGTLTLGGAVERPIIKTYPRILGTLILGGAVQRPMKQAMSKIKGMLRFGGSVRPIILKDTQSVDTKKYLYKVYDAEGNYIEVWKDVISEPNFTAEINQIGSTMNIELARTSDSLGVTTSNLLTEDDQVVQTEDNLPIQVRTMSRNQIGPGSSVQYNHRVDVYAYYGAVEPLLTEDYEPITTEDGEALLASTGAPNGRRIFTGFISEINTRYGNSDTVQLQLTSYGWDLNQYPLTNLAGETTVSFLSVDPSDIVRDAVSKFVADSAPYNTYTNWETQTVESTGTTVSYTFKANTYADVLDKTLELMPENWYYYVGLGDNLVYFRERSQTARHKFYLGKHIKSLDLKGSILDVVNRVLFTGGGDPALYIERTEAPAANTRRALELYSDGRVTLQDSAEVISDGIIEKTNKVNYRTTIEILSGAYDIESINVGDVVGFRNFGNFVDELLLQIVGISYTPDVVQLQLETKPPTINKRLADIRRQLAVTESQNIPDAPS